MRQNPSMRERIAFLRGQAKEFRRQAEAAHDPMLHAQFADLAERCERVAANIERNLSIHEGSDRPHAG